MGRLFARQPDQRYTLTMMLIRSIFDLRSGSSLAGHPLAGLPCSLLGLLRLPAL
jgi:hypothetical protein